MRASPEVSATIPSRITGVRLSSGNSCKAFFTNPTPRWTIFHCPVPDIVPVFADVSSAILTIWVPPDLYGPVTTGTLPPPRGDESETHATIPRTVETATNLGDARKVLGNCFPQRICHSIERSRNILVTVRGGHETRLERRWRQINPPLQSSVKKLSEERHVRSLGIGEIANGILTEEKPPHRPGAFRRQRHAELLGDHLQTFDQRGRPLLDTGM